MKKSLKRYLSILIALALCLTLLPAAGAAVSGGEPEHWKRVVQNENGTYTISLDITGDSEKTVSKANVVVVVDTSRSMNEATGNTEVTYTPTNSHGNSLYGLVNGEYVPLHRVTSGPIWNQTSTYYYPWTGSASTSTVYTGQRYSRQVNNQSRLEAAQDAINDLAQSLLANNGTGDESDIVEMALVSFATNATVRQQPTTSYSDFSARVNALTANGGTNWEAGLTAAGNIDFNDSNTTYIIFVSDGNPTFRDSANGYTGDWNSGSRVYGTGQEGEENVARCYAAALSAAAGLVQDGFVLFTIGVYGNVSRMESLAADSGAGVGNYYAADDTAALQEALADILGRIELAGIAQVHISDGTTSMVTTGAGVVSLLKVDEDSYKYYRAGGSDGAGGALYDPTANGGLGEVWAEAPAAELINGVVEWDLSEVGVLENGVKYTITFECSPSQFTFDLIADLNNGDADYNELDENIRRYLINNGNGSYSLLTNTSTSLSYIDTREENPEPHVSSFNEQEPMPTEVSSMVITKRWLNELDAQTAQPVEMRLVRDGVPVTGAGGQPLMLSLNSGNGWSDSVYIAVGQMTTDAATGRVNVFAPGHDYVVEEPEGVSRYWEMEIDTVRPMLLNGSLENLVLLTENEIPQGMEGADCYTDGSGEYCRVEGKVYRVRSGSSGAVLTATNYRRSYLDLKKTVIGAGAPADAQFTFSIGASDPHGERIRFAVYGSGSSSQPLTDIVTTAEPETENGQQTGFFSFASGSEIIVTLQAGWNLRIGDLLSGTEYEIKELQNMMPASFAFEQATTTEKLFGEDGSVQLTTEAYELPVVSQAIQNPNADYSVEFTNRYELGSLRIVKQAQGAQTPEGAQFTVTGPDNYSRTLSYAEFGNGQYTIGGLTPGSYRVYENEQSAGAAGYSLEVSYTPASAGTAAGAEVTVEMGETAQVTVTNEYTRNTGDLLIRKSVEGLEKLPETTAFTVTGPDDFRPVTISYADFTDGEYLLPDVPSGAYSVVETGAEVGGYSLAVSGNFGAEVESGKTGEISIINSYVQDTAKLIITKTLGENSAAVELPEGMKFTVAGPDNYFSEIYYGGFTNGSYELAVPVGEYTVSEDTDSAGLAGYSLSVSAGSQTVTLGKDEEKTAEIENTYTRLTGTLYLVKDIVSRNYLEVPGSAVFTVTGPDGFNRTVTYSEFSQDHTYILEDVPAGTYMVSEQGAEIEGYGLNVQYGTAEVTAGEEAELRVVNVYTRRMGGLRLQKTASGADVPDGTVFTITGPEDFEPLELTYGQINGNGFYAEVPTGEYTVTENEDSAQVQGYTLTISGDNGTEKTVSEGRTTIFTIANVYSGDLPEPPPHPPEPPEPPELDTENHYGYIIGYPDGTIRPEGNITRAEVATIFFRMLTDTSRREFWSTENDFTDVSAGDWYNNAVSTLAKAGVISGYPNGSFRPDDPITREELAAMAAGFLEKTEEDMAGADVFSDIGDTWARDFINLMAENEIINGYGDGTFRPQQTITRAETMALMNRLLKRAPDAGHLHAGMATWPDNADRSAWYYAHVQEAANSHVYTMNASGTYEVWTAMQAARDWTALEKEWSTAGSATGPAVTG